MLRLLPFWAIRTMRLRTTLCELGSLFVDAPSRERVLDIGSGRHHFLSKTIGSEERHLCSVRTRDGRHLESVHIIDILKKRVRQ